MKIVEVWPGFPWSKMGKMERAYSKRLVEDGEAEGGICVACKEDCLFMRPRMGKGVQKLCVYCGSRAGLLLMPRASPEEVRAREAKLNDFQATYQSRN